MPDIWDRPLPTFDPDLAASRNLESSLAAVSHVVGARGLLNPPVMLDGLTTLSGFRTPEQLCLDLLDRPDQVRSWCGALTTLYLDADATYCAFLSGLGHRDTTTWLKVMAEGRMEAVQCDFAVMLSPAMFEEFPLPDLGRIVEHLDYSLYHLDGVSQLRFLDLLRRLPKLNGIQWNPEPGLGSPVEWLDAFRRIRDLGFCLYVACGTVDEAVSLTRSLGPDGLFLVLPRFDDEAQARRAIATIGACC